MAQYNSLFPGALDTFILHGSRDGIGFDIDFQESDELSSNELDLICDAILELQRAIGVRANPTRHSTNLLDPYGGVESWSGGVAVAPDGWTTAGAGAGVAQQAVIIRHGNFSARLTRAAADCSIWHTIDEVIYYRGRTVTLGCWVYATVANRARIQINDGVDTNESSYHSGVAGWEFLTVTHTCNAAAIGITAHLRVDNVATLAYFDAAILVEGTICPTYMPAVKPIYLITSITDGNWDGDGKSDADSGVLDLSTFGNGCPPGIKAVLIGTLVRDVASAAAADCRLAIGPDNVLPSRCHLTQLTGVVNNKFRGQMGWVPCDANGDVFVDIDATGVGSMTVDIRIWGYVLGE